jgi:hypothetical protein
MSGNSNNLSKALLLGLFISLQSCTFVGEQLKDKADEDRLLKPSALDMQINLPQKYPSYSYKFMSKYQISHDFYGYLSSCHYAGTVVGTMENIYEQNGHTWQGDISDPKPFNFDRYTRAEWRMGPDGAGNYTIVKGYAPVCFQSWGATSHVLTVKLYKKDLNIWKKDLTQANPNGKFSEETINNINWLVQKNDIAAAPVNGDTGGAFLHYSTAIGDTGYTLTMQLGANQDSLKHPQAHTQMQAIFQHLIESVKIEPLINK